MKILVLTIEYPPLGGGASPMSHEINKNYIERGHHVEVVTMSYQDLPSFEITDGVMIHRVPCKRSQKHISYPSEHISYILAARKFLKSYLKDHPFDVCHAHFIIPTGIIAKWVYRRFKIPFIITAHGSDVPGFNPDRFNWLHRFSPPLLKSIINAASAIVVPSLYLGSLLAKVIGQNHPKVLHIPNGINTDYFISGIKQKTIVSSGRLLERKGFHHLIAAVSEEDLGYTIHICGDGPMMETLKQMAATSKTQIIFHGWIDNRDELFKSLLAQAAIYCLVSSNENASTALMEAMSCQCAVITSDVSGCPETVGQAGLCIPFGDTGMLNQALKNLIKHSDIRNEYGVKARKRAISQYGWNSITDRYQSALKSTLTR